MPVETIPLFLNPAAGRGRAAGSVTQMQAIFAKAGIAIELHLSHDSGDVEAHICERVQSGNNRIVVAGGDGSVHEAVNGIMRAGQPAALGVIPVGTGNDFAKACSIPLDWKLATAQLAQRLADHAPMRRIDVGRMNDRFFANGAGIGFDARVTRAALAYRWPKGDLVYLLAILRCMIDGIPTPELTITADDYRFSGPVTLASISNGPWVGGMFHIAPMADNADGKLELLIADPVSRLRILSLLPALVRGRHLGKPEIRHASVRAVQIRAAATLPSQLDGEVQPLQKDFAIDVLPAALQLL